MRANHSTSRSGIHAGGRGYRRVAWAITLLLLASCLALVLPGPIHAGSVLVFTKTGPPEGGAKPGIQVSKTGPLDALVYETITYTIAIQNTGKLPLTNVFVTDSLLSDFYWDVGNLPVKGADYTHVMYHVTPDSPYPLRNVAFAHGKSSNGDVSDKSEWTVKAPGLFGYQFDVSNVCTREGYESYTAVQNVGGTNANVTATYYGEGGNSYQQSASVPANGRYTFTANETPDMPAGDYSAVIESDQPIVASQWTFRDSGAYGTNGILE